MPASPADIAAASRDVVVATWSSTTIAARYPTARDGSVTPSYGLFDDIADAQAVINARGGLIGTERRRFAAAMADVVWPNLSAGFPTDRLVDAEHRVAADHLVSRIEVDLDAETTSHELFG